MADKKFSQFLNGDEVQLGDQVVGLRAGTNYRFSFPSDGMKDGDGNYFFKYASAGAASQNFLILHNSAASNALEIEADGASVALDITLSPKGLGTGVNVPTPSNGTHAANKDYVDSVVAGDTFYFAARLGTVANFTATYNNGALGFGATLTATSNGAASFDGVTPNLSDIILVRAQTNTFENGLYVVSQVGDGSNPAILTRADNYDVAGDMKLGASFSTVEGNTLFGRIWMQDVEVATLGTDPITFIQIIYMDLDNPQTVTASKTFSVEQFFSGKLTHTSDTDNFINFGTDTQDYQTGGSSRLDISNSGIRLGGANSRITTILDEDDMSSDSDTAGVTQQSVKAYVDTTVNAVEFYLAARLGTVQDFSSTYDNGTAGVGATLTATSNGAASFDGVAVSLNDFILVRQQTNTFENGLYSVTQVGDGSNPAILTRATTYDTAAKMKFGMTVGIVEGDTLDGMLWQQDVAVATVGTDPVTYTPTRGSFLWTEVTATSASMAVNNGYIANNGAQVDLTLPATALVGKTLKVQGKGAGGWKISQNAGQTIHFGSSDTMTGIGGSLESTNQYDSLELVCITEDTDWAVLGAPQGTLTVT